MNRDIEIMAKTMYGEARGEYANKNGGLKALIAIGNVIKPPPYWARNKIPVAQIGNHIFFKL